MEIDRKLQREILEALKDAYPVVIEAKEIEGYSLDSQFMGNLLYLEDHGLIETPCRQEDSVGLLPAINLVITARGLDFLEDDGGLSAILETVTIRFDNEQIRALLSGKIESADLPAEKKGAMLETIRTLPSEALKTVCTRLINLGLDNAQDAYRIIQTGLDRLL